MSLLLLFKPASTASTGPPVVTTIRVVSVAVRDMSRRLAVAAYKHPGLMPPTVVQPVAPVPVRPIVVKLARPNRRPKNIALLQPWAIRGPPPLLAAQQTVRVRTVRAIRTKVLAKLYPPATVQAAAAPPVVTTVRVRTVRAIRTKVLAKLYPPAAVGRTPAIPVRVVLAKSTRRPTRSRIYRPAVVGTAAAPPVVTTARVSLWRQAARRRTTYSLRPPAVVTPAPKPPTFTGDPVVTGTTVVGQTLTSTTGTAVGAPTIAYAFQWQRDSSGNGVFYDIPGATLSTLYLSPFDLGCNIRSVVTATNGVGMAAARSNIVGPVTDAASQQRSRRKLPPETRKIIGP